MASRALSVLPCLDGDAMEPERPPPALVSDVLEEIFLRAASPADLARASAACVSFRALISSPSFLRRYRSVHPPLLLGFLNPEGFHPVEASHPSAAGGWTVDFSFLPQGGWLPHDARDGRVLVGHKDRISEKLDMGMEFRECWDIAVCDPVFQRYLLLPPMTDDLLVSVGLHNKDMHYSWASLIPSGGREEETSFGVICWMFSKARLAVFIFSSASSPHWAAVKSIGWADLGLPEKANILNYSGQCVYGCYYWKLYCRNELLKLDMDTMEFSKYDLPPGHHQSSIVIVESGEGKVAMFSTLDRRFVEYYDFIQNGAEKSNKWRLKSTIPFPVHDPRHFFISGQAEGYVFLSHIIEEQDKTYSEYFSVEVKSCNIERACRASGRRVCFPYFGFPPSMSPRRIQGDGQVPWCCFGALEQMHPYV